jgi:hypothetical protein
MPDAPQAAVAAAMPDAQRPASAIVFIDEVAGWSARP